MSPERTAILGAIAGFTIYLGLPVGRIGGLSDRLRGFLSVLAAGILLFIFWDVLDAAHGLLAGGLEIAKGGGGWSVFALRGSMAVTGLTAGALGLGWIEHEMLRRRPRAPMAGGSTAAAVVGGPATPDLARDARRASLALGLMIATAIGLRNAGSGIAVLHEPVYHLEPGNTLRVEVRELSDLQYSPCAIDHSCLMDEQVDGRAHLRPDRRQGADQDVLTLARAEPGYAYDHRPAEQAVASPDRRSVDTRMKCLDVDSR